MTMGDRIVVLNDGVIQQVDTPLNLYNDPANLFVAGFIGSPAMNFLRGKLVNSAGWKFQAGNFQFTLPNDIASPLQANGSEEFIMGVRPESMFDLTAISNNRRMSDPQKITIDVVEPIGNEIFLYFAQNDENYCMRCSSSERMYKPRQNIDIGFDLDKLYFFNPQTQERVV